MLAILIDNAVRYADPGTVRVEASVEGSGLAVRVADGGPGITQHRVKHPSSGGSGLGLQLCRALVVCAGGSFETERDGADGTTFVLRLPFAAG